MHVSSSMVSMYVGAENDRPKESSMMDVEAEMKSDKEKGSYLIIRAAVKHDPLHSFWQRLSIHPLSY